MEENLVSSPQRSSSPAILISAVVGILVLLVAAVFAFKSFSPSATSSDAATVSQEDAGDNAVPSGDSASQKVRVISMDELSMHNSESSCWIAVSGQVYDVTSFIGNHPGGKKILNGCGRDATDMFSAVGKHTQSGAQEKVLPQFAIGYLEGFAPVTDDPGMTIPEESMGVPPEELPPPAPDEVL